jgi:hypothetical protein
MTDVTESAVPGGDVVGPWRDPPGLGRSIAIGSAIGAAVAMVGVTLGVLATGEVWESAVGLGLFVALWGGLGFGSMIGGVVYVTRLEAHGSGEGRTDGG